MQFPVRFSLLAVLVLVASPAQAQLTIRLTSVPASTPATAAVHVAGSFNAWNPGASNYALARQPDGTYGITLPGAVRGAIEFKFTLGSWQTVETTAAGADIPNRTFDISATGADTLVVTVAGWRDSAAVAAAPTPSTASPSVRVLSDSFAIPQLGRTRRVWIYLPPGYGTSGARYPVLYMHDGQNVFDAATSYAGEWGVDESLDSLHTRGDRGAIVVAVDNGGTHRLDEYDPWKNADPSLGGGEGDEYVDFLVHTLKPYVDRHYRTLPDARHTGIMGSSMGGLISLYATLKYPQVFGRAGAFSCACWIAKPEIMAAARHARVAHPSGRFYFVVGGQETKDDGPARDQMAVVDSLEAAGVPTANVRAIVSPDGKHAEWFWRREFPAAYEWLFDDAVVRVRKARAPRRD